MNFFLNIEKLDVESALIQLKEDTDDIQHRIDSMRKSKKRSLKIFIGNILVMAVALAALIFFEATIFQYICYSAMFFAGSFSMYMTVSVLIQCNKIIEIFIRKQESNAHYADMLRNNDEYQVRTDFEDLIENI